MIVFPNCKINLGLRITGKRSDGYHNLETVFYPLPLYDIVEIIRSGKDQFSTSGLAIETTDEDNLCVKALGLLRADHPSLTPVAIHLHKAIPSGAGLGGGSADAAFTLKLLNEKFALNLSTGQLISYALRLGSDCPFFIVNKPCYASGRGELLEPIDPDLSGFRFIIVNPGIHISTAKAFAGIVPADAGTSIKHIIRQPVETWKDELVNDFEKYIFIQHPEIAALKKTLYDNGAEYAALSGSGSTVFGIFGKNETPQLQLPSHYFVRVLNG